MFKSRIKDVLVKFRSHPSRLWATVYIVTIPVFALVYWLMPSQWFGSSGLNGLFDALYFSTITITTLGFGDICPISLWGKILVIAESLSGILSIGLFMNAVALKKSRLDAIEEKQREQQRHINAEKLKLQRQYVVVEPYLKKFIDYATIVTTPMIKRGKVYPFNPNFDFHDLCDLYHPTLRLADDHSKPCISYFYKALHGFEERAEIMLRSVDFSLWPEIEQKLLIVLRTFRQFDFEDFILSLIRIQSGGKPATIYQADLIKNWNDEIKFYPSNSINSAVALFYLIKTTVPLLQQIDTDICVIKNSHQ